MTERNDKVPAVHLAAEVVLVLSFMGVVGVLLWTIVKMVSKVYG